MSKIPDRVHTSLLPSRTVAPEEFTGKCYGFAFKTEPRSLDFRWLDGRRRALAYAHLVEVTLQPPDRLEIRFTDAIVAITGSRLGVLYQELIRHRVLYICTIDPLHAALLPDEEPEVFDITFEVSV